MRKNAGTKLQDLSVIIGFGGSIISFIAGVIFFIMASENYRMEESFITAGIVVIIVGIALSVVLSMFIDGFGALVDNSFIIVEKLGGVPVTDNSEQISAETNVDENADDVKADDEIFEVKEEDECSSEAKNTEDNEEKNGGIDWLIIAGIIMFLLAVLGIIGGF